MEINNIIKGDCIKLMRKIRSNSVDLIITDPPYGDNIAYGSTVSFSFNPMLKSTNFVFLNLSVVLPLIRNTSDILKTLLFPPPLTYYLDFL